MSGRESAAPYAGANCLVTGGLGFIGANVAHRLAGAGADVTVVDAMVPTHGANPHNLDGAARPVRVIEASIADVDAVGAAVSGADYVFNIAGQVSHLDSMEDPLGDLELNARSHLALLELLRATNAAAPVVYTSTRQIYGRPKYFPVDEDHPVQPVDVNGVDKFAGEQFHLLYARVHGMHACSLRLTNTYGPRMRLRDDRQGFVASFVRRAITDDVITLYGDGSMERDMVHVDDVVDAILLAAVTPATSGEVVNLGHTESLTLAEVAHAIVDAAGSGRVDYVPWPADRAAIDIGNYQGDFTKAHKLLGWEPAIDFVTGIESTVAYYREHRSWYL